MDTLVIMDFSLFLSVKENYDTRGSKLKMK